MKSLIRQLFSVFSNLQIHILYGFPKLIFDLGIMWKKVRRRLGRGVILISLTDKI